MTFLTKFDIIKYTFKGGDFLVQLCLIGILVHLLENENTTARELSEKFEVSTRSIYRYVDILACNGIPILTIKGSKGGIKLDKNFCLSSSLLNEDEKDYLFSLLKTNSDTRATNLIGKLNLKEKH